MGPQGAPLQAKSPEGFSFNPDQLAYEGSRVLAYGLRELSRRVLHHHHNKLRGLLGCGFPLEIVPGDSVRVTLTRRLQEEKGEEKEVYRVHFHGIRTCGSPWACPVCSRTIAEERAEALSTALAQLAGMGFRVAHVVLTVRHTQGVPLVEVFGALARAWRWMTGHRAVKALWKGAAWARTVEVTYGRNGWHPHIHLALALPPGRDPWALKGPLIAAWLEAVAAEGWEALPEGQSYQVAATVEDVREIGRYVSKPWGVGGEVAGGALKGGGEGLTPWELLGAIFGAWLEGGREAEEVAALLRFDDGSPGWAEFLEGGAGLILREFCGHALRRLKVRGLGVDDAAERWEEFALATKGRKAFTSSRTLTLLLRQALEEAQAQEDVVEEIYLARKTYLYLLRSGRLAYWAHIAEVTGSLVLACDLLGLVEGDEWLREVVGAQGPPEGEGPHHLPASLS